MRKISGIYQIKNTINNKVYIGSSVDIQQRWREHRSMIRRSCHSNPHLQNSWNKYGEDVFVFEVLEETDNPLEREQWYLDNLIDWGREGDYNIAIDATSGMKGRKHSKEARRKIGENHPCQRGKNNPNWGKTPSKETRRKMSLALQGENNHMWGKHHSKETRRKMRENHPDQSGENSPVWGKHHSEETKRKISESMPDRRGENGPCSKLTNEQVWNLHVKNATGNYTHKELAEPLPVKRGQVSAILRGHRWKHVYDEFHHGAGARS